MIVDYINNADFYPIPKLSNILNFIAHHDFSQENDNTYILDGNKIFYMISEKNTYSLEEAYWEAHKKYIDIHYIIEGTEIICSTLVNQLKEKTPYDAEKDLLLYNHTGKDLINPTILSKNQFMVLYPHEAHMTNIYVNKGKNDYIKKAIFKILL